jgi:hypothetical protein
MLLAPPRATGLIRVVTQVSCHLHDGPGMLVTVLQVHHEPCPASLRQNLHEAALRTFEEPALDAMIGPVPLSD